ncbi:MAG: peptide chain release factor N(5)-glutamine methyltransferase [Bacteroidota bacterium]
MTLPEAHLYTLTELKKLYDEREAANICNWVLEHVTGKKRVDRLLDKAGLLPDAQMVRLTSIIHELATHRPVQYVLGEAWFGGMKFYVNESVLIPRPETDELVEWIWRESQKLAVKSQKLLDIGTGSGCIPVSLKKKLPDLEISAIDVSDAALMVARQNASDLGATIAFAQLDFLAEKNWDALPVFDIIVSNPPYIKQSEESSMHKNVLAFEPSLALFVPDDDALLFYRKIALFGKKHLSSTGSIFLEINEALGKEVISLYETAGYTCELRKDMQGKGRMVKCNISI